jgi:hypothetical protein
VVVVWTQSGSGMVEERRRVEVEFILIRLGTIPPNLNLRIIWPNPPSQEAKLNQASEPPATKTTSLLV